jgi:protease-4
MEKLGVSFDRLSMGRHAAMFSPNADYSEAEWMELNDWLDRVYDDFTGKVAEEREIPLARVHEIARGRVWTGADALELGLVDELGDLSLAIERAAGLADLTPGSYEVRVFPEPPSAWDLLKERRGFRSLGSLTRLLERFDRLGAFLELLDRPAPLEARVRAPHERSGR